MGVETMGNSFYIYSPIFTSSKPGPGRDKTNILFSYRYFSSTFIVYHTISNFDRNV